MSTRRQEIIKILSNHSSTVSMLATELGVRISEVVDHLIHVQHSIGNRLRVEPATCRSCGFTMNKRTRFTAPSRCPKCKSEDTTEPLLTVESFLN